ncbi:MAG: hypothetical protein ABUS54_03850 [Actinomycetota bacterium]
MKKQVAAPEGAAAGKLAMPQVIAVSPRPGEFSRFIGGRRARLES